jgi:hypothetical protein
VYINKMVKIKHITVCPHSVFTHTGFVFVSEQIAIRSIYSIKLLVFITEKECVYSAVGVESLNIIPINLSGGRLKSLLST